MITCDNCGLCCRGIIGIYPEDEIFKDDALTKPSLPGRYYSREMITTPGNLCIALTDGRCSIYDKRPMECRAFEMGGPCCLGFRDGSKTEHNCQFECVLAGVARNSKKE